MSELLLLTIRVELVVAPPTTAFEPPVPEVVRLAMVWLTASPALTLSPSISTPLVLAGLTPSVTTEAGLIWPEALTCRVPAWILTVVPMPELLPLTFNRPPVTVVLPL